MYDIFVLQMDAEFQFLCSQEVSGLCGNGT